MSREDEDEFLSFLRADHRTVILPGASATSGFTPLNGLPEPSTDPANRRFWLQNTAIDLPLLTEFDEQNRVYLVNGFQSPVIEFLRSFTISGMMLPGRLEADMTYFDDDRGDLVSKPVEFKQWVESIEAWIKKNYRHLTLYTYAGPGAEKFQKNGGTLH